ncbi:MAG: hypothetical protein Q8877_03125, partial [Sweet potato little leaf phytoplasma]|nr:hypothetical protein [Sweet potato little leaf phytoplasma]
MEAETIVDIIGQYSIASGQQINFDKSSIMFSSNCRDDLRQSFGGKLGIVSQAFLKSYFGLPTHLGRAKNASFQSIYDRVGKRLIGWKEKLLSRTGKEVLIKAVIQAIPSYAMNVFKLPHSLCSKLTAMFNKFWWGSEEEERKIHWMSWKKMCVPKHKEGLSFRDLEVFNLAMLAKQGWNLLKNPHSLIGRVLKTMYFPSCSFLLLNHIQIRSEQLFNLLYYI